MGLGNPEEKYVNTRHNLGYRFIDYLAEQYHHIDWDSTQTYKYTKIMIGNEYLILIKGLTGMNSSGQALLQAAHDYKVIAPFIYVVYDDLHLPFGYLRIKKSQSSGGHKGVASIIDAIGTRFTCIKFGIGSAPTGRLLEYVLGDFTNEEQQQLPLIFDKVKALPEYLHDYPLMVNVFNGHILIK